MPFIGMTGSPYHLTSVLMPERGTIPFPYTDDFCHTYPSFKRVLSVTVIEWSDALLYLRNL
jgi:hypothetical protein